jgi:hypothetical protein
LAVVEKIGAYYERVRRNKHTPSLGRVSDIPHTAYLKDDLVDKIDQEFDALTKAVKDGSDLSLSEFEFRKAIRDAIYNAPLSYEAVQALMAVENVLDDAYELYTESSNIGDVYELTQRYLEITERGCLADRLFLRAKDEHASYIDEVKKMPPDKIIGEADKIAAFNQILDALDPVTSELGTFRIKGLMAYENTMSAIYENCKNDKGVMPNCLADAISDFVDDKAYELKIPFCCADENENGQEI